MLHKALLPALFLLLVLCSCAKDKASAAASTGSPTSSHAFTVDSDNLAQSKRIAKDASMTCDGESSNCSPSVGLLSMAEESNAAQCTGSLVAPDIVLTNAHCVPADLRTPGAACAGRVYMNFARRPGFETQIGCSQILIAKNGGALPKDGSDPLPDYAFIRLDRKSVRPVLRLSRAGMKDAEILKIEKVDPVSTPGALRGTQGDALCRAVQNTVYLNTFTSSVSATAEISGCEAYHGNSGSPLTGSDGAIRGVLFAITDQNSFVKFYEKRGMVISTPEYVNVGANLACLTIPSEVEPGSLPAACAATAPVNSSLLKINEGVRKGESDAYDRQMATVPAFAWLHWTTKRKGGVVQFIPTCVDTARAEPANNIDLGQLNYGMDVSLDGYTRFRSMKFLALGARSTGDLIANGAGYTISIDDGLSQSLKPCTATTSAASASIPIESADGTLSGTD